MTWIGSARMDRIRGCSACLHSKSRIEWNCLVLPCPIVESPALSRPVDANNKMGVNYLTLWMLGVTMQAATSRSLLNNSSQKSQGQIRSDRTNQTSPVKRPWRERNSRLLIGCLCRGAGLSNLPWALNEDGC